MDGVNEGFRDGNNAVLGIVEGSSEGTIDGANPISNEKNTINFFDNEHEEVIDKSNVPKLHHAYGTTTISFKIKDEIIIAVDSRATLGNFVGSCAVQKVLPISKYIIGTMAGDELQYFFDIFLRLKIALLEIFRFCGLFLLDSQTMFLY